MTLVSIHGDNVLSIADAAAIDSILLAAINALETLGGELTRANRPDDKAVIEYLAATVAQIEPLAGGVTRIGVLEAMARQDGDDFDEVGRMQMAETNPKGARLLSRTPRAT